MERYTLYDEKGNHKNITKEHNIITEKKVPTLGVMLVGLGGNNGSTLVAGLMANKKGLEWETKNGMMKANFYGSFTQSATCHVGFKQDESSGHLEDVYKPVKDLLPMVDPCDIVVSGWDISGMNLYEACKRAKVLEPDLLKQLKSELQRIVPLPAALNKDYIAANQETRADNLVTGSNREVIEQLRQDIRDMKARVDKVVLLWTANTEQYYLPEIDSADALLEKI